MMKIPCKSCICFPCCKSKYKSLIDVSVSNENWKSRVLLYFALVCPILQNFYTQFCYYSNIFEDINFKTNPSNINLPDPFEL